MPLRLLLADHATFPSDDTDSLKVSEHVQPGALAMQEVEVKLVGESVTAGAVQSQGTPTVFADPLKENTILVGQVTFVLLILIVTETEPFAARTPLDGEKITLPGKLLVDDQCIDVERLSARLRMAVHIQPLPVLYEQPEFAMKPVGLTASTGEAADAWPFGIKNSRESSNKAIKPTPVPRIIQLTERVEMRGLHSDRVFFNEDDDITLFSES